MVFRQEIQLALRAGKQTFTDQTARTDRDFRLDHVVPGIERIAFRIKQHENTILLVLFEQEKPRQRQDRKPRQANFANVVHAHARDIQTAERNRAEHQTRAQVRLQQDQRKRRQQKERRIKKSAPFFQIQRRPTQKSR